MFQLYASGPDFLRENQQILQKEPLQTAFFVSNAQAMPEIQDNAQGFIAKVAEEEKVLPLTLDKISLTGEEIARLENQGYFIMSDKKYYFPEIIRFALEFKYVKGARPRVLSLLAK